MHLLVPECPSHLDEPVECQDSRSYTDSRKGEGQNLQLVALIVRDAWCASGRVAVEIPNVELGAEYRFQTRGQWCHCEKIRQSIDTC